MSLSNSLIGLSVLGCFLSTSHVLFAQLPQIRSEDSYGLTISSPSGDLSPDSVSDLRCTLTNNSSKVVGRFVVLWTLTMASGAQSTVTMVEDKLLIKSAPKLEPGQSVECESSGSTTAGAGNPIAKVEVGIDYVEFVDGSKAGKDTQRMSQLLRYRDQGANDIRSYLRGFYKQKGIDALLQELNAN